MQGQKGAIHCMDKQITDLLLETLPEKVGDYPSLLKNPIDVKPLTPIEAIGDPGEWDYPLLRGKEVLLQASFKNSFGQAFTGVPKSFYGTLEEVFALNLNDISNRAIFIAAINAVLRSHSLIENTVHCRDSEPVECGRQIAARLHKKYGQVKVGIAGYQPAFIKAFTATFGDKEVRVTDLSAENVDKTFSGAQIWDGISRTDELIAKSDLILVTGSVFVNGTEGPFLTALEGGKELYFYGTTVSGPAYLLDLPHICLMGS